MSERALTPADEDRAAREHALDPRRSILLQAPAGSGKTTVLSARYLRLLAHVDEPEEILAITFTRKAAAEMRERVLRALHGELPGDGPHERRQRELAAHARAHAATRGWRLELHPGRLRIQTIDALSHWIAAQLPVEARAGGRLRVAARPQQLYRLAARRTLADADSEASLQPAVGLLFERLDNDHGRLEALLAEMLEKRAHWLRRLLRGADMELHERVAQSLRDIVSERIGALARLLPQPLVEEGAGIARLAALNRHATVGAVEGPWRAWLETTTPLAPSAGDLRRWQALAALALGSTGEWRRTLSVREGFPPADRTLKARGRDWIERLARIPGTREALLALAALPAGSLAADDAASLAALAAILTFAAQQLEVVFHEQGQVDYSYVAAAARRALTEEGAPSDLALRLGARLRHLLVDEFQDTSIDQLELLEALTAGWDRSDGSSVFAVGDPMQSIYLFREAEVGLFLRARDRGLGSMPLESLRLTRNFRATPELVEWSNTRLARIFPPADDIRTSAVSFLPSTPGRAEAPPASIELHCTQAGEAADEAAAVAALVQRVRADDPCASIAILVSSRLHAAPITTALEAAGIAVAGKDLVPLGEVPVVGDLANLACALDHPGDRSAWLAVLRAPWCGLTLAELQSLLDGGAGATILELLREPGRVAALGPDARLRVQRTLAALEDALAERDRLPTAAWIEATWHALGGPAACASDADLAHAEAFFIALARRAQAPDWRGPAELEELLGELYAGNPGAPGDAVQIMTVHAAKGLEFDHVVLPGLGRRLRPDREPLMRWIELPRLPEGNDLLIAPLAPAGSRARHAISELIRSLQRERLRNERARLLYVALTRARQGLYLFGHLCPPRASEARGRPESGTLLELLWPAIDAEFPAAPERAIPPAAAAPRPPRRLERLPAAWRPPPLEPAPPVGSLRVGAGARAEDGPSGSAAEAIELTGLLEGELVSARIDRTFVDAAGTRWVVTMLGEQPGALQDRESFVAEQLHRHARELRRAAALARTRLGPEPVRAALHFTALGEMRELSEDA